MTLDEAVAEIEALFEVVIDGELAWGENPSLAATGEEFVTIMSGGIKDDYARNPALCFEQDAAVRLWREAVLQYAGGRGGALYWRQRPMLEDVNGFFEDCSYLLPEYKPGMAAVIYHPVAFWAVYSRLLVSPLAPMKRAAS